MTRRLFVLSTLAGLLLSCAAATAFAANGLLPLNVAAAHGLTRAWATQVQMDTSRGRVAEVLLHDGVLFVQTDQAMLHAIDAETGQTLWVQEVGSRRHPSLTPAANENMVAVINGSRLYVLNRFNGKLLWQIEIDGAPGAGPALSSHRVYVPSTSGMLYSYQLKPIHNPMQELGKQTAPKTPQQEAADLAERRQSLRLDQSLIPPLAVQSTGRTLVQPVVTRQSDEEEFVAWTSDRGYMFVGSVDRPDQDRFTLLYRLQTNAEIVASPTYMPPDPKRGEESGVIYAVSRDGFVHAVRGQDGQSLWRFPAGEPIVQPAAVINDRVYAATQPGGMYCLDAKSGKQLWWVPHVAQFVAASRDRVYVSDKLGQLLILDAKNGARLDTVAATAPLIKMLNPETDRIYLATQTGLIQCLHETELSEPIHHPRSKGLEVETPVKKSTSEPRTGRSEGERKAKRSGDEGGLEPVAKKSKKKKDDDEMGFGLGDEEKPAKKRGKAKKKDDNEMDFGFGDEEKPANKKRGKPKKKPEKNALDN